MYVLSISDTLSFLSAEGKCRATIPNPDEGGNVDSIADRDLRFKTDWLVAAPHRKRSASCAADAY